MSFVHLHTHTMFSSLDGASHPDDIVRIAAEEHKAPAIAATDHGNMEATTRMIDACNKYGIKAIAGEEFYMAEGPAHEKRPTVHGKPYYHQNILARNEEGYKNLLALSSMAFDPENYHYKQRIDMGMLAAHSEGLIITTTCLASKTNQLLLAGRFEEAVAEAATLRDIADEGSFFVEVMNHGIDDQVRILNDQRRLAEALGVPMIATNDSHYTYKTDRMTADVLSCVGTGTNLLNKKRFTLGPNEFYFKSPEEMQLVLPESEFPGACSNTLLVAEMVDLELSTNSGDHLIPDFPLPDGFSGNHYDYLMYLVEKGCRRIYGDDFKDRRPDVRERYEYEMSVIDEKGYVNYFLILGDILEYVRDNGGLVGPGRGSGAGSLVAYAMGITAVDPLKYGLMFERFLNPERPSAPDIDTDLDGRGRELSMLRAIELFGEERVAQIGTHSFFKPRQALKDAAGAHGVKGGFKDKLASQYPAGPPAITLKQVLMDEPPKGKEDAWKESEQIRQTYASGETVEVSYFDKETGQTVDGREQVKDIIDTAANIEGLKRHDGVHAGGVLMCPMPVVERFPTKVSDKAVLRVTQYDNNEGHVESLGGLKYDMLGLSNLTYLAYSSEIIKRDVGVDINVYEIPIDDDPAVMEMLGSGDTHGVFQLSSEGMSEMMKRIRPTKFEDLAAALAIYRPGPMAANVHYTYADRKNGREKVDYIHPELEGALKSILDETYGLVIYQEQVMLIAQELAGYTRGQADILRKAMGKKKLDVIEAEAEKFYAGMRERGFSKDAFDTLWGVIVPFSEYAFNKSHSVAYAVVSWWTAWLKHYYPAQFLASFMDLDKADKIPGHAQACIDAGVSVYPPDINRSLVGSRTDKDSIWLGLSRVSHVSDDVSKRIVSERAERGDFSSPDDFVKRCYQKATIVSDEDGSEKQINVGSKHVENLVAAGAFDSMGYSRRGIYLNVPDMIGVAKIEKKRVTGFDLFGFVADDESTQNVVNDETSFNFDMDEWPITTYAEKEAGALGALVGENHPFEQLSRYVPGLIQHGYLPQDVTTPDKMPFYGRGSRTVVGVIESVSKNKSKVNLRVGVSATDKMNAVWWPRGADIPPPGRLIALTGYCKINMTDDDESEGDGPSWEFRANEVFIPADSQMDSIELAPEGQWKPASVEKGKPYGQNRGGNRSGGRNENRRVIEPIYPIDRIVLPGDVTDGTHPVFGELDKLFTNESVPPMRLYVPALDKYISMTAVEMTESQARQFRQRWTDMGIWPRTNDRSDAISKNAS
jgi:DNA polymerase-3 subunit alpha